MVAPLPRRLDVYRWIPPDQAVAAAITWIDDVLLRFTLTFRGSLLVTCAGGAADGAGPVAFGTGRRDVHRRDGLQLAGAALDRIADGLFVSSVRADEPRIESAGGHRFTHERTSLSGPRTRRFTGRCSISIGTDDDAPAVSGSLGYVLDVTAAAPSDPPDLPARTADGAQWSARYDRSLASIGAVVLAPVPVVAARAARLYPT